jgi:C_GCAxxG_C_C family probable redox protein
MTEATNMQRHSKAGQAAFNYHNSGYHCAEAVSMAIIESYGSDNGRYLPNVATAFGGGVGRTKQEICGALSGGIIALGYLFGRSVPEADWTAVSNMAAKLKHRFVKAHGTTNCGALLATFGPQDNMMRCKQLSGEVAGMLVDIINERKGGIPAKAVGV